MYESCGGASAALFTRGRKAGRSLCGARAAEWPLAKARAPLGPGGDLAGVPLVTVEDALTPTSLRPELLDGGDAAARSLADNSTAQALVAAGITLAFIPRLAVERGFSSEWAELEVSVAARRIGIVWRSDRTLSRSERHFVELARRICSALASEPAHSAPSLAAAFSAEASDERAG